MDVTIMRSFNKLANLHRLFFKRAAEAAEQGVGAVRRTLTPAQRQDADEIINGFNDLKKPVDPKALMAERAVHRYEPTFQVNPQTRRQLSDKDISDMQSAFGGPPAAAQKPAPNSPMMAQTPNAPAAPAAPAASYPQARSSTPFRSNMAARNPGGFFSRRGL